MPDSAIILPKPYDFAPSGQSEDNTTTLDTYIASLTPWGYWKLNEASGVPQDSSGNARHGAAPIAPSYSQAPITSKVGNSIRFDGARLTFPGPQTRLGALSGLWTIGGLFYLEAELGTSSPAASVHGSPFFGQNGTMFASNSDIYVGIQLQYGDILIFKSGINSGGGAFGLQLNQAMSIFIVGTSVPGVAYTCELWINGVRQGQVMRGNAGSSSTSQFQIGKGQDAAAPFAKFKASNICCWNSELTPIQMMNITQLMLDKAAYLTAYKP